MDTEDDGFVTVWPAVDWKARAERAEAENARLRKALINISNRPSCMVWGEDYEMRACVIEMEGIADAALKGTGDE